MRLSQKQCLFTQYVGMLICWAGDSGYHIAGREWQRTLAQQHIHIASGRSQSTDSLHLDSLAIDFVLYINGIYQTDWHPYEPLGVYWETLDPHNVWGGRWPGLRDGGHFEYRG